MYNNSMKNTEAHSFEETNSNHHSHLIMTSLFTELTQENDTHSLLEFKDNWETANTSRHALPTAEQYFQKVYDLLIGGRCGSQDSYTN